MSDAAAVLELPGTPSTNAVAAIAVPEVGCPKCGNLEPWGSSSWCPQCGYYPRLGSTMESGDAVSATAESPFAPKTPLDVWVQAPAWMKVMCIGVLSIFGASVAARIVTPDKSIVRSLWGTCQLLAGLGLFVVFHVIATLKATFKNNRASFMDAVVHPIEVWRPTIEELPKSARRLSLAVWGFTAAVCAMAIVGGIRYSVLVDDWGFRQRAGADIAAQIKAKALQEAMAGAKQAESLEEAIKNAAANDGGNNQKDSELEMLSSDCVVVGYGVNPADKSISELLLASVVNGELKYVGSVQEGISADARRELAEKLPRLQREKPIVKCPRVGVWVRPVVACRTKFKSWTENNVMKNAVFQELLADLKGG